MTITITALPLQGTVLDTTLIPVETAGVTGHIAATSIKNYISSATLTSIAASSATLGPTTVAGTLSSGAFTASSVATTGDVVIGGNLIIVGLESVGGNISAPGFIGNLIGNVTGTLIGNVQSPSSGGSVIIGNLTAYVTYPNQPYITNLGTITLDKLTANANIAGGNLSITGISVHGGAILPTSNAAAVNIGSTGSWFNNVYGTAIHALYADLAERYTSDSQYTPGTVVVFGTDTEVTASKQANDPRVAGVVSTNPAYTMNAGVDGVDVALQGRVPCQVTGEVKRGDLMVTSSIPGVAMASSAPAIGTVIGKALGTHTGSTVDMIEVVVGRI